MPADHPHPHPQHADQPAGRGADSPLEPQRVVQWAQERGEVGGVMTSHRQMTEVLRAAGHDVSYVDTGSLARAVRAVPSLLRGRALHVLHITRLWRAAQLAPVLAVLPGTKALVLHSGSTEGQLAAMRPAQRAVVLRALHVFDELWVVNAAIRDLLPEALGARTTVVTPFDPRAVASRGSGTRDPHALALATNSGLAHYNAQAGVEAVRQVRSEWPDATLHLLAYGHEGAELARLRSEVAGLDWVELDFDVPAEKVNAILARSGVLLRPTSWDGDSVIVREALAMGARVVASDASPRPRGVELAGIDAAEIAEAVLRGGRPSDGAGLVDTTLAEAATHALGPARSSAGRSRR